MGGWRGPCRRVCPPAAPSANYGIGTANRIDRTTPIQQPPREGRAWKMQAVDKAGGHACRPQRAQPMLAVDEVRSPVVPVDRGSEEGTEPAAVFRLERAIDIQIPPGLPQVAGGHEPLCDLADFGPVGLMVRTSPESFFLAQFQEQLGGGRLRWPRPVCRGGFPPRIALQDL